MAITRADRKRPRLARKTRRVSTPTLASKTLLPLQLVMPIIFNLFAKLPAEIRLMVWRLALDPTLVIAEYDTTTRWKEYSHQSIGTGAWEGTWRFLRMPFRALLGVCQESRHETRRHLWPLQIGKECRYMNYQLDTLLLTSNLLPKARVARRLDQNEGRNLFVGPVNLPCNISGLRHVAIGQDLWPEGDGWEEPSFSLSLVRYTACSVCGQNHDWCDESARMWKLKVLRRYASGSVLEIVPKEELGKVTRNPHCCWNACPIAALEHAVLRWKRHDLERELTGPERHAATNMNLMEQTLKDLGTHGPGALASYRYKGKIEFLGLEMEEMRGGAVEEGNAIEPQTEEDEHQATILDATLLRNTDRLSSLLSPPEFARLESFF